MFIKHTNSKILKHWTLWLTSKIYQNLKHGYFTWSRRVPVLRDSLAFLMKRKECVNAGVSPSLILWNSSWFFSRHEISKHPSPEYGSLLSPHSAITSEHFARRTQSNAERTRPRSHQDHVTNNASAPSPRSKPKFSFEVWKNTSALYLLTDCFVWWHYFITENVCRVYNFFKPTRLELFGEWKPWGGGSKWLFPLTCSITRLRS